MFPRIIDLEDKKLKCPKNEYGEVYNVVTTTGAMFKDDECNPPTTPETWNFWVKLRPD